LPFRLPFALRTSNNGPNIALSEVLPGVLLVVGSATQSQIWGVCHAAHGERVDVIDIDKVSSATASAILRDEGALAVIA
jgi:hypothetical protein